MAKFVERDITPSKLTPEQVAKQVALEKEYAFQINQANLPQYGPGTKYEKLAKQYRAEAKAEATTGRAGASPAPATESRTFLPSTFVPYLTGPTLQPGQPGFVGPTAGEVPQQTPFDPMAMKTPDYVPPAQPTNTAFNAAQDKILADTLASYGMQGMAAVIAKIRAENPEISSEDLTFLLKNDARYNSEYLKRFAGNAKLKAAGLPTMDDSAYLKAEKEYEKIFLSYGAKSLANRDYYATLIGNSMDAVDVTQRLNLAYDRLQATPDVKSAFKKFYGAVTDGDILSAMLDPVTQIPQLEQKVKAAEIGGAALAQKLDTSLARASELAAMGVTGAQAQTAYQTIGMKLPTGKFLSEISPEEGINYTQTTAENIAFKKLAADKLAEDRLVQKEIGRFGGSSGRFASKDRAQGLI
jgi:hypothetical protein